MTPAMEHCQRPWWKRPPVWFIAILVVALVGVAVVEQTGKQPPMSYSIFLDQVDAGNVANAIFNGTEISGSLKHPLENASSDGKAPSDVFRTRVPDIGDPTLVPALHRQHVVITVASPSGWAWLLARLPWPMLIIIGAVLIAGLVRVVRGKKAQPGSAASSMPMHGMIGLVTGLFTRSPPGESSSAREGDEPKSR
jgi:ATP-dependent Zn protease